MPIFHFNIASVKRSAGQQATGAAAYRAGEIIRDERTGKVHNHAKRQDVRHKEILLPSRFGEAPMEWARNRVSLWNAAEAAEKRRNSRVAREFEVALPAELNPEQRLALSRTFAREIADRYGVAVDLAIHDPKPGRDSPNFHAHLLATTREVSEKGLGAKAGLDMRAVLRAQQGLAPHAEEYSIMRERWATLTNEAFREANLPLRVDHRTLTAQGIDRKPLVHIPMEFFQLERQGMPKEAAERLRADYRARVAAYRERSRAEQAAPGQERSRGEHAGSQREQSFGEDVGPQWERSLGAQAAQQQGRSRGEQATPAQERSAGEQAGAQQQGPRGDQVDAKERTLSPQESTHPERSPGEQAGSQREHSPGEQAGSQRQRSPDEHAGPSHDPLGAQATHTSPQQQTIPPRDSAGIRRRAVQEWLQMRSKEAQSSQDKGLAKESSVDRGRDDGRAR